MKITKTLDDPNLFRPWFGQNPESWRAWRAFLKALFALPMTAQEREIAQACTGRTDLPDSQADEAWLIVGRRGGKSFTLALLGVFLACFKNWKPSLAPGERGTVMILAADRRQARTIFRYASALVNRVPMLARLIERETSEEIDLASGVTLAVHTASYRSVRGYTLVAALLDEVAFWRDENSANPDAEIIAALRPAMATVPGSILLAASSPYSRRGELWRAYQRHHGNDGDPVLCWQAPTWVMNPQVPQRVIDDAYEADPSRAAAEYGAEFRSDLETFLDRDLLSACTRSEPRELPYRAGAGYFAFADPSGGRGDAFTLAIGHQEDDGRVVVDLARARRAPFDPDAVTADFVETLRAYGLSSVTGDHYSGEWVKQAFAAHGVEYKPAPLSASNLYLEALPLFTRGAAELPDHPQLIGELAALERRTAPGGRERIDHPPGGHDDLANAVAGALYLASRQKQEEEVVAPYAPDRVSDFDQAGSLELMDHGSPWSLD